VIALDSIVVGDRVRKDMGDLKALADSMARHGLLHPVVIKSDNILIAGARRIEAARLLEWTEIPATVIDVADLLSAERDENAQRKDFTPTEAVAIGRLIEAQERPRSEAARRIGGVRMQEMQHGVDGEKVTPSIARGRLREIIAPAVGMSGPTYQRAKAVVVAAEANPEHFGDLPARMDETGNVTGTHQELLRRGGGKSKSVRPGRHPVHNKLHHARPNDEIQRAVTTIEGLCIGLSTLEVSKLDPAQTKEWAKALAKASTFLRRLSKKVANVKGN